MKVIKYNDTLPELIDLVNTIFKLIICILFTRMAYMDVKCAVISQIVYLIDC